MSTNALKQTKPSRGTSPCRSRAPSAALGPHDLRQRSLSTLILAVHPRRPMPRRRAAHVRPVRSCAASHSFNGDAISVGGSMTAFGPAARKGVAGPGRRRQPTQCPGHSPYRPCVGVPPCTCRPRRAAPASTAFLQGSVAAYSSLYDARAISVVLQKECCSQPGDPKN